jgi:two-component system nitrate/nitrite response regulator NarL
MDLLTKRRQQVAKLACRGLSNRQIAKKLGLTEGTVKIHLHAIYEKLHIHSRAELTTVLADRGKSKRSAALRQVDCITAEA